MILTMDTPIKDRILGINSTAPRYTSYPPATAFQPGFIPDVYRSWLAGLDGSPLSLYYHIPFCKRLCYYCGCNTNVCNDDVRLQSYVNLLQREARLIARQIPHSPAISHIHFGGGSPSILPPALFSTLMDTVRDNFNVSQTTDIAIEVDPRQCSEALIATYARHGIKRISLGVQDFDGRVLKAVNRPQPFHLSWDAVTLCRAYGIHSINLDLMYGLPGQTVATLEKTMHLALSLKPDRIAFFGYAHVPWMKKHMRLMTDTPLPDAPLRYDLYAAGSRLLEDHGYLPVGIDHFVRPTDSMAKALGNRTLRRNFQGYTTDTADTLIGFGASAISHLPDGFVQNATDLRQYISAVENGALPVHKGYAFQKADRIYSDIISELMCYMAIDLHEIAIRHDLGAGFFNDAAAKLIPLLEARLIGFDGTFLRVYHPHAARITAACFDPMIDTGLETATPRHSSAV